MNVQRDGIYHKAGPFGLACPLELRVKVGIEAVSLLAVEMISLCCDQTYRRIVQPLLTFVGILLDFTTFGLGRHRGPNSIEA